MATLADLARRILPHPPDTPVESRIPASARIRFVDVVIVPAPTRSERLHHLDALRGLLMLLGIVLHASLIYSVGSDWVVGDPQRWSAFDLLYDVIHSFRMQTFFIISGFLTVRMLKKGTGSFLRERSVRLLVPFVIVAIALNSVQTWIAFGPEQFWAEYTGGRWVGHLWFMFDLLVFCLIAATAVSLSPRLLERTMPHLSGMEILLLPCLTAAGWWFSAWFLKPIGLAEPMVWGLVVPVELMAYFPYFMFGLLFRPGSDPVRFRRMAAWSVPLLVFSLWDPLAHVDGMSLYAQAGVSWAASLLCLYLGSLLLAKPLPLVRTLADASYTVYLLHHLAVVTLGMILVALPIPIVLKFVLVVLGAGAISFWVHFRAIAPNRWLRFLLNGQPPASGTASACRDSKSTAR